MHWPYIQEYTLSNKQAINMTSLNLIQSELMVTIDTAATHLETFISERDNSKALEDCINALQQIRGSLDLVQLHGACELAGEILATATAITGDEDPKLDNKLAALTKGFFVLRCYFEYTQQHEMGMPVLLIAYINDIRLTTKQAIMPEFYFEPDCLDYSLPPSERATETPQIETILSMVRRFRHMYQVGLLGFVRETQTEQSLKMMHRAIQKIAKLSKGTKSETLWWLAVNSIYAFTQSTMQGNVCRKRLFSQLDRCLKEIEKTGVQAFDSPVPKPLIKELVYYIALANIDNSDLQKIVSLYGVETLGYNEDDFQRESIAMTGPSADTVQSVADVLRIELATVKESIEQPEYEEGKEAYYESVISRIQKIKEILSVVGLTSAADTLDHPLSSLQNCKENQSELASEDADALADAFLYVESVLNSLHKRNFSGEKLSEINRLTQTEMISANHLQDAQLVVIEQAEMGLTKIKQALTAYSDSNYDNMHINEVSAILDELRGGMIVLSLPRAAAIIASCSEFVEKTLLSSSETAPLEQMLETFADALICVEYYLDCMKVDKHVSADTLAVAEESLAALGHKVSS